MTCSIPGVCSHSPDCSDHNCLGRPTTQPREEAPERSGSDDGVDDLGRMLLVAVGMVAAVFVFVELVVMTYAKWRWL